MRKTFIGLLVTSGLSSLCLSVTAWGAGFENETLWSGQNAGVANAVVSSVSGSQSIYFNPAGLAGTGGEASLNFSPTFSKFQGPVLGVVQNSKTSFGPVFGVTASYALDPKWGVGIGIYTSGGGKADYDPVSFASIGLPTPANLQGDLSFNEVAVGTGYEILPGLKVGAAWRGVMANATLALPNIVPAALATSTDTTFSGVSQFSAGAYKVGIEWSSSDKAWSAGASYRSKVDFDNVSGSFTTTALANGATVDTGTGSLATVFPSQISIGAGHVLCDQFKVLLQYDWVNYGAVDAIGASTTGPKTGTNQSAIPTNWSNQADGRIGLEWSAEAWQARLGYIYASQVVPIASALPIFTGPGPEQTVTAGLGKQINPTWRGDLGFAYNHSAGSGQSGNTGTFANSEYGIHLGTTFAF